MTVANGSEPKDTAPDAPQDEVSLPGEANPGAAKPGAASPGADSPSVSELAAGYAEKAGLHRNSAGHVDMLKSAGGVQGIAESILPDLSSWSPSPSPAISHCPSSQRWLPPPCSPWCA